MCINYTRKYKNLNEMWFEKNVKGIKDMLRAGRGEKYS
jgi:hypothetical protein